MAETEDEQLAKALAASLADQQRLVTRTDEEEELALSLALAASLADQEEQQQFAGASGVAGAAASGRQNHSLYPPIRAPQINPPSNEHQQQRNQQYAPPQVSGVPYPYPQPPSKYPSSRQQHGTQQQQQQQPYPQQPKQQLPALQQQQPQPQGAAPGSSSSGGDRGRVDGSSTPPNGGREWRWSNPLKLLDSAVQKVAGELGGSMCPGCGKVLGFGPALRALGKEWHPSCFRCAGCQQPLGFGGSSSTFSVGTDGQPYHMDCHRQLFHPRCYVCGDFIPTRGDGRIEWRENPFWKNPHCPAHSVDGTSQCCSCNRLKPIAEEWVDLQDGRQLCLECLDTLVVDTKDAQPLYDEVLQFFAYMGMPHPYKVPLLLVEGPVLEDYADREGRPRQPGASGPIFHVRGLCVAHVYTTIPSVVRTIGGQTAVNSINTLLAPLLQQQQAQQHCTVSVLLVMYGLPRLLIGSIVAHELMHAYLRMRNVAGLPLQVEEGLCQLMALLWLDSQDHWAQQSSNPYQQRLLSYLGYQIRTDTSEVYGEGFRIALEKFQQRGLRALVEHVIAHHAWPNWTA